jgi:hypothetical protein
VGDADYPWDAFIDYHMLGDSPYERIGAFGTQRLGGYDPVNIYAGTGIFVLNNKSASNKKGLSLQVDRSRVQEFAQILAAHNISRESKLAMNIGFDRKMIMPLIVLFMMLAVWIVLVVITSSGQLMI